jgi:hypothetical protein
MPHYNFDLVDHITVQDEGGQDLADDIAASDIADELADRIYQEHPDLSDKGYFILVSDEEGREICRAAIRPAILA